MAYISKIKEEGIWEPGKPIVAITIGDPAGIGPEIVVKSLFNPKVYAVCRPLIIGDKNVVEQALTLCQKQATINVIQKPWQGTYQQDFIDLIDMQNVDMSKLKKGTVQAMCGRASIDYINKAIELADPKQVDAIATAPVNTESIQAAGIDCSCHTEMFGTLTQTKEPLIMFEVRELRIFFLSQLISLREACQLVTQERIFDYIIRCTKALKSLGVTQGTLAVASLNPRNCEKNASLGDEEIKHIEPAVQEAQVRGYQVVGPISVDFVFHKALQGHYNGVLSLHHAQGHVAAKTLDFDRTISVTTGLPFLRSSVEHGTAFDIAGRGIASEVGMTEAILVATKYAPHFKAQA